MRSDSRRRLGAPVLLAILACAQPLVGQDPDEIRRQLEESQGRLEQIRAERARLETQLGDLTNQVHDVSEEIQNIERQIAASASAMVELDVQIGALLDQVTIMTRDMLLNRDRLTARKAVLHQRLREIYKRGPLATFQVLLSSRSFADLITRYRYLHDVAMFDRLLVREVEDLEGELAEQRSQLAFESDRIRQTRDERVAELDRLEQLERQRQRRLTTYANQQVQAQTRLTQLADEEEEVLGLITTLEARRRDAERTLGASTTPSLTTSALGQLDWPVDGRILYGFGPQSDGATTIFREGVGIAAPSWKPGEEHQRGNGRVRGPAHLGPDGDRRPWGAAITRSTPGSRV